MNRYWLGIGAGALAVFGVGMVGLNVGKRSLHELKTAMVGPVVAVLQEPISVLRFRLDGERIGDIRLVEVQNEEKWTENAVRVVVKVDGQQVADRLRSCAIVGDELNSPKDDARFRCVAEAELAAQDMVQIGAVDFEPLELSRPLYVHEHQLRQLERSDLRRIKANFTSTDGRSVNGQASFDVQDHRGHRTRHVVKLHAGDGRALIDVRDERGRAIFNLNADENGVSVRARDKRSRDLFELIGGVEGLRIKIDAGK